MRGLLIRVGVIVAILVAGFILRDFISGNATDLHVGDCFDEPAAAVDSFEDVQHHPCTEPHDAEVIFVNDYEPISSIYPSESDLDAFVLDRCSGAFAAYTGLGFDQQELDFSYFWPTAETWAGGQHKVICYAVKYDGTKLDVSVKKSS